MLQPSILTTSNQEALHQPNNVDQQPENKLPSFEEAVLKHYRAKDYKKCIKVIERILKVTPRESSSHYKILLAASHTMIGKKIEKSHSLLDEVLAGNPNDSYALYGKGVAYFFQGMFEECRSVLDRAIEANPEGMERARDMKKRVDLEMGKVKVQLRKLSIKIDENGRIEDDSIVKVRRQINYEDADGYPVSNAKVEDIKHATVDKDLSQMTIHGEANHENKVGANSISDIKDTTDLQTTIKIENPFENQSINFSTIEVSNDSNDSRSSIDTEDIQPRRALRSSITSKAQEYFDKGLDLYMAGKLKKCVKMFRKALKLESDFEEAEETLDKAQEFLDMLEVAEVNMEAKNYLAVVEIMNNAMEVDEGNDFVNRELYYKRGLSYYYLEEHEKSLRDYEEFDRLNQKLGC